MKNLLLYTFLLLVLINSCKKEKVEEFRTDPPLSAPTDTLYMSAELKSYYFFPEGSWWVYQQIDTNAQIYDTATVVRSISEIIYTRRAPFAWEHVAVNIEHTHYPSSPRSVSPYLNISMDNDAGFTDRISMVSQGRLFNFLPYFFSVPIDSISMERKSNTPDSPILLDTNNHTINNNTFNSVVHLKDGSSNSFYEIWMAKNIGIIKYYNADDDTEWELIDYQLNK